MVFSIIIGLYNNFKAQILKNTRSTSPVTDYDDNKEKVQCLITSKTLFLIGFAEALAPLKEKRGKCINLFDCSFNANMIQSLLSPLFSPMCMFKTKKGEILVFN